MTKKELRDYIERLFPFLGITGTPAQIDLIAITFEKECTIDFRGGLDAIEEMSGQGSVEPLILQTLKFYLTQNVGDEITLAGEDAALHGEARLLLLPNYRLLEAILHYCRRSAGTADFVTKWSRDLIAKWNHTIVGVSKRDLEDETEETCGLISIMNVRERFCFLAKAHLFGKDDEELSEQVIADLANCVLQGNLPTNQVRRFFYHGRWRNDFTSLLFAGYTAEELVAPHILFRTRDRSPRNDLSQGQVSLPLQQDFMKTNGALSNEVAVRIKVGTGRGDRWKNADQVAERIKANTQEWLIDDKENERQYLAAEEENGQSLRITTYYCETLQMLAHSTEGRLYDLGLKVTKEHISELL